MICHGSGYLKINNSTNIIVVIFINTQLKILKYPIENYSSKLWYPIENADTQFTKKVVGIYPMYSNPYLELWYIEFNVD